MPSIPTTTAISAGRVRPEGSFVGVSVPRLTKAASSPNSAKRSSTQSSRNSASLASSAASATADTSLGSSASSNSLRGQATTPKHKGTPTVLVPPVPRSMTQQVPVPMILDDDDDDLTSLGSGGEEEVVVAQVRPILSAKPANAKKGKGQQNGKGREAKLKKRKVMDGAEGVKAKKPKGTGEVPTSVAIAGPSHAEGEGNKSRAKHGSLIRCHQCRTDFTDGHEQLLRCSKVKPRVLTKAECDVKGLDRSKAPTSMERCKTLWCAKCLRSRYGHEMSAIRVSDSDDGYDWECPVCIGDCNCSTCRKRQGLAPTGIIDLKASGVNSVRELLTRDPHAKGKGAGYTPAKKPTVEKPRKAVVATKPKKAKKASKPRDGSSSLTSLPADNDSSDLSDLPSTTEGKDTSKSGPSKAAPRRAPRTVLAPKLVIPLATQNLSTPHLLTRINIREFAIRFRHLMPGMCKDDKNRAEVERAEKILESMDDPIHFWSDDEAGMRTIVSGLLGIMEREESRAAGVIFHKAGREALDLIVQLKKELKTGVTANSNTQGATQCWETCRHLLALEGFTDALTLEADGAYIATATETVEERRAHYKIRPEEKVAIIVSLVELSLRSEKVRDDILQGVEREKIAKMDIAKNRARVNKQWAEVKAKLGSTKPSTETLFEPGKSPSKQTVKIKAAEAERIAALEEWEEEMREKEQEHRTQIRLFGIAQYLAGTSNRLRFDSIGRDTRGNEYFIFSETPNRTYPSNRSELAWSWSYNLVIHGAAPDDSNVPQTTRFGKTNGMALGAMSRRVSAGPSSEADIDMLEGGERDPKDQWLRIGEPHEIRQLASWIHYEAVLLDRKREWSELDAEDPNLEHDVADDHYEKRTADLVERCHAFAEFLDLRVTESETGSREAARAGRAGRRARIPIFGML